MSAVDVWHGLLSAYGRMASELGRTLQDEFRVSLAEFEALLWISRTPDSEPVRATELIEKLLLTQSSITRLLARLERAGYIERTACEDDARRRDILLTAHGRSSIEAMREVHRRNIESLVGQRLDADEAAAAAELLRKLA